MLSFFPTRTLDQPYAPPAACLLGRNHRAIELPACLTTRQRNRPICAVSAAPEARLRPAQTIDGTPPGKRSDFVDASEEFQRLCEYQLRLISDVFAYKGELIASIYIRLPGSLRNGSLELQRICWTPVGDLSEPSASHEAIFIGGPGSNLTEESVTAQSTFSLPGRGHVVFPIVSNSFLVGLLVIEGFNRATRTPANSGNATLATPAPWTGAAAQSVPSVLPPPPRPAARPHGRGADAAVSGGSQREPEAPDRFACAKETLAEPAAMRLLLLTAGVLSGACAMELRSVLLTAAQVTQRANMSAALEEIRDSTATMRTLGHMLRPRLGDAAAVESSITDAMLTQSAHVAALARELEEALQPLSVDNTVRTAGTRITAGAEQATPLAALFPQRAALGASAGALAPLPAAAPAASGSTIPAPVPLGQSSGAAAARSAADRLLGPSVEDSQWMVLRSIDDYEEAGLMSEGDALSFGESDDWRPTSAGRAVSLLPRPVRRRAAANRSAADASQADESSDCEDAAVAMVPPAPMRLCNALDVVGRALLPVVKLCDAVGVELVMLSSALLAHMDGLVGGRRRPAAAVRVEAHEGVVMRVADADSAARAISHALDSSMQRVAERGRMMVDVAAEGGDGGDAAGRVHVTIADTGVAAWTGEAPGGAPAQCAQDAMQRLRAGQPVGSGETALRIAQRFAQQSGGVLSVGRWRHEDAEYIRTVITFRRA
eukprot:jgi/Ulvmu1/9100/UM005_0195.1